jgi:hypothetical protein
VVVVLFRVGLENNMEGRSIAWAVEHPGCFAYGATGNDALENLPAAIEKYIGWAAQKEAQSWLMPGDIEIQLDETWETYQINEGYELVEDGYEVNAWFLYDWKPLGLEEIERGLKLLSWSRADLLETVKGLSPEKLKATYPNERWSIAGILKHIGGAEWWYLNRLGLAFQRQEVPQDPFERLDKVRSRLEEVLPEFVGSKQVVGIDGEFWSPRKLLRRAAWHERDHTIHIRKLI